MKIIKLFVGDIVEMKKNHPCGGNQFKIMRVGSDVRVVCLNCSRDMTLDRIKFEKSIKKFIVSHNPENIWKEARYEIYKPFCKNQKQRKVAWL